MQDLVPHTPEVIGATAPVFVPGAEDNQDMADAMSVYMRACRRYPLLTAEQERELALRNMEGDAKAAERLVTSNLRLVCKITREYPVDTAGMLDCIQEGNAGLVRAVQRFNPDKGAKLSTYSAWWIRAYVLAYIMRNWRMVRIGTTNAQRKLFFNLGKMKRRLEAAGVAVSPENVAKALDVSTKDVVEMDGRLRLADESLATPKGADFQDGTIEDDLIAPGDTPDVAVERAELLAQARAAFAAFAATLDGREALMYTKRLMPADDAHPWTLRELGEAWGVVRERARQIEVRLLKRMRAFVIAEVGPEVAGMLAA